MITKLVKYIFACSVCCCIAAALNSCAEWDDHYNPSASQEAAAQQTLWKQLQQNPQLSDFCQVLQQTKVFRHHKKTAVSYADLLDQGQTFTLVAPVNGSFNRDSLLQLVQTNQGDSIVEKTFVMNHLSRSTTSLGTTSAASKLLMLNAKHLVGDNHEIEGVSVTTPNIHARNGILHITSRPLPYRQNLYEAFSLMPQLSTIGAMLRAAEQHLVILVDGFIMTACALAACRLYPEAQSYMVFGHCGDESGHRRMLDAMHARPLLTLGLRLGEGTGALCAFPLLDSAVRMMNEMNNFDNANITKYF